MRPILRHGVRHDPARTRRRLEAACSPATVDVKAPDGGEADDRTRVGRDIHDPRPLPVHAHAREQREHLDDRLERVLDGLEAAALAIAVVLIDAGADHQIPLVALADVGVNRVAHHDRGENRLQRLRDQRLQRMALDGQAEAGHAGDHRRMARGHDRDLPRLDEPPGRIDADDRAVLAADTRDLAVLDDVDTERIGRAREAPGHGIVPRHPATALQRGTEHGITRVEVDEGNPLLHLGRRQHLGVDAVQPIRRDAPLDVTHVLQRVPQVHDAALAEHHVVVQRLRQPLPQLHRLLVEVGRLGPEVVGAHDGRVAGRVAAAQVAALDHRDVVDAVLTGQVKSRCETVPAGADDHDVVFALRLGRAPLSLPAFVVRHRVAQQGPDGEFLHHRLPAPQHSTMFTASPPSDVSLYFVFMSAPVSRIVLITLSRLT